MDKKTWTRKIRSACKKAGTYQVQFNPVIDTLASIMEERDKTLEFYTASGSSPVVRHTNKAGATNLVKNPALNMALELNAQALAYWRDLGLTPAGLRRISEDAMKPQKRSALVDALNSLGEDDDESPVI